MSDMNPKTILVVDDTQINIVILQGILEVLYTVRGAASGREALRTAAATWNRWSRIRPGTCWPNRRSCNRPAWRSSAAWAEPPNIGTTKRGCT